MRTTHKLLAVMVWLGSAQASADPPIRPSSGSAQATPSPNAEQALQALLAATADVRMRDFYEGYAVESFLTTPRRLATGAPACGNVGGKPQPLPCTLERADELAAIRHAEMLAAVALAHTARARFVDKLLADL